MMLDRKVKIEKINLSDDIGYRDIVPGTGQITPYAVEKFALNVDNFEFYKVTTNFNITYLHFVSVCSIIGVEIVKVITRYSMVIGLQKDGLFINELVLAKVRDILLEAGTISSFLGDNFFLCDYYDKEARHEITNEIFPSKHYVAYIAPNGKKFVKTFDDKGFDYSYYLFLCLLLAKFTNGRVSFC